MMPTPDATTSWMWRLHEILELGVERTPRGTITKDQSHAILRLDMRKPVITVADRKLNYQFMAAEARWILTGDDTVDGIVPWNKHIGKFSDNGKTFFGAYGPKIVSQLDYVIEKLDSDLSTRQAGLTLWRESPPMDTKDYPCTIAMFFAVRDPAPGTTVHTLDMTVFMRSSDAWLGIPYDVFSFSMVAHLICARLNKRREASEFVVAPGAMGLMMASSHLYESNFDDARVMIDGWRNGALSFYQGVDTPAELFMDETLLIDTLTRLRDTKPGDPLRWWEKGARVSPV